MAQLFATEIYTTIWTLPPHSDDGSSLTRFMKLLDRTFSKLLQLEEKFTGGQMPGMG